MRDCLTLMKVGWLKRGGGTLSKVATTRLARQGAMNNGEKLKAIERIKWKCTRELASVSVPGLGV